MDGRSSSSQSIVLRTKCTLGWYSVPQFPPELSRNTNMEPARVTLLRMPGAGSISALTVHLPMVGDCSDSLLLFFSPSPGFQHRQSSCITMRSVTLPHGYERRSSKAVSNFRNGSTAQVFGILRVDTGSTRQSGSQRQLRVVILWRYENAFFNKKRKTNLHISSGAWLCRTDCAPSFFPFPGLQLSFLPPRPAIFRARALGIW